MQLQQIVGKADKTIMLTILEQDTGTTESLVLKKLTKHSPVSIECLTYQVRKPYTRKCGATQTSSAGLDAVMAYRQPIGTHAAQKGSSLHALLSATAFTPERVGIRNNQGHDAAICKNSEA